MGKIVSKVETLLEIPIHPFHFLEPDYHKPKEKYELGNNERSGTP
jgi:hypothetical protein